jgi:hypothetical protein
MESQRPKSASPTAAGASPSPHYRGIGGLVLSAHRYCYFTPYQENAQAALRALRDAEFRAGRYNAALRLADPPRQMSQIVFPLNAAAPAPGPVHSSIEAALEDDNEIGTGSILDLIWISERPGPLSASAFEESDLYVLFGTLKPSRKEVERIFAAGAPIAEEDAAHSVLSRIGWAEGRYVTVYEGERPSEIFFLGHGLD